MSLAKFLERKNLHKEGAALRASLGEEKVKTETIHEDKKDLDKDFIIEFEDMNAAEELFAEGETIEDNVVEITDFESKDDLDAEIVDLFKEDNIDKMTKKQFDDYAKREFNIDLDRRKTKESMLKDFRDEINNRK